MVAVVSSASCDLMPLVTLSSNDASPNSTVAGKQIQVTVFYRNNWLQLPACSLRHSVDGGERARQDGHANGCGSDASAATCKRPAGARQPVLHGPAALRQAQSHGRQYARQYRDHAWP